MLLTLPAPARELADCMSSLCEEAYCAAWMDDLEFELWDAVVSGPKEYGRLEITRDRIAELQRLSTAAGGWIIFDEAEEESLLPIGEWEKRFDQWKRDQARR